MAALWGENHERDIRDAMWNNTVEQIKVALLVIVILIVFTSPAWLYTLQSVRSEQHIKEERQRIDESLRSRERQVEEWNREHFGVK